MRNEIDLARHLQNILILRPEIQVAYIGIGQKCFEIQEPSLEVQNRGSPDSSGGGETVVVNGPAGGNQGVDDIDDDSDEDWNNEEDPNDLNPQFAGDDMDDEDTESLVSASGSVRSSDREPLRPSDRLVMREILFYDDKVEVFKARHCKL